MARRTLPSVIFDMLDDPIVMAVMSADGLDKESVLRILDHAAQRLPENASKPKATTQANAMTHDQRSTASRMALIARTVLANTSPLV